ncbi:MAG: exodeoxyribonuclease VII large subunit [Nitrospira sp.]
MVRAIARSRVPVVSAVGHEIDVTLSDFAADHRAPTPSAAAEAVVPVLAEIMERLDELIRRLRRIVDTMLLMQRHRFERSLSVLGETRYRIQAQAQRLDELQDGLTRILTEQLTVLQRELMERRHVLLAQGPHNRIERFLVVIPQLCKRLEQEARRGLISRRQSLAMQMTALDALSPLAILQRGFSIVHTLSDRKVLRRASDVAVGEAVQVTLAEGQLVCQVEKVVPSSIS